MDFTIHVPWLTRMRRVAIGLSIGLVLVASALPASAAPPEGIEGEVTVVNGTDQPVPITGDVTADVTGSVSVAGTVTVGNEATDPVPVSGDVNADVTGTVASTQSGDWNVGLDGAALGHLSSIDNSTSGLSYDPSGNLNVNIADGTVGDGTTVTTRGISINLGFGETVAPLAPYRRPLDFDVTSFAITSDGSLMVSFRVAPSHDIDQIYTARVIAGTTLAQTFPFPIRADTVHIVCDQIVACEVWGSISGY